MKELHRQRDNAMFWAIANEFRLPLTVLDDYLPELTRFNGEFRYPSGTWERLQMRGVTAKMIGVEWGATNV